MATYYSKHKDIGPSHPVVLRYTEAMKVLTDIRDGRIDVNPLVPASAGAKVINTVPGIFSGSDSNIRYDPRIRTIVADTPPDTARPGWDTWDAGVL